MAIEGVHRCEGLHGAAGAAKQNDEPVARVMKQEDLVAGQYGAGGALGDGTFQAVGVDGGRIAAEALLTVRPADDLVQDLACWFREAWLLQPTDMQQVFEGVAEPLPAAGMGVGLGVDADVGVPIASQRILQPDR
ncbi:hypothetical protein D3C78_1521900 [compost metagenome]